MNAKKMESCVVPVALQPHPPTQLRVVAYRPKGDWLRNATLPAESTAEAAHRLLSGVPHVDALGAEWAPSLEPVGFVESATAIRLIYTVVLPSAVTMVNSHQTLPSDPDWGLLAPWLEKPQSRGGNQSAHGKLLALDETHRLVLNYWRQHVEESTAGLDLLPRYFTTTQVRAVYSSIWGTRQDPGNFHRWLHTFNAGACREVEAPQVRRKVHESVRKRWKGTSLEHEGLALASASSAKFVGTSPLAFGALASLGSVALVGAVVGGLVAYQGALSRGKDPKWYTRSEPERRVLKELYSPRPAWLTPGPIV